MNYLKEILAFNEWMMFNRLSTGQIVMWYVLMYLCNRTGWKKSFTVPVRTLILYTGLSERAVYRTRDALVRVGLIRFKPNGRCAGAYTMNSVIELLKSEPAEEE